MNYREVLPEQVSYFLCKNAQFQSNKDLKSEGLDLRFLLIITLEIAKRSIVYCSITKSADTFIVTTAFAICW